MAGLYTACGWRIAALTCALLAASLTGCRQEQVGPAARPAVASALPLVWKAQGPAPNTGGQVENIANMEVEGAVHALAPHPTDANTLYIGSVNGGIWKTTNAMDPAPHWESLTPDGHSLSIGALEFDPTDSRRLTLVAGHGSFSSFSQVGGELEGLLRSTDGMTWRVVDCGGRLRGFNFTGLAPRGNVIVAAAVESGVWRSQDTGATCTKISGLAGAGLPEGGALDLVGDPKDPARLYVASTFNGIFRSVDTGATWTKISDATMDVLIAQASNIKIAVGTSDNVYVAVAVFGALSGVFRSGNGGAAWRALDIPVTVEGGVRFGIHPGGQAGIHMSIAADPADPNLVYIGGDRQPSSDEATHGTTFPNSLGAMTYSGRLFRIDASKPTGSQAIPLTHRHTASASAPHADSRRMRFAASGVLIEADDGGVYRRTSPQTAAGDWFSMNGNLQVAEFHSVAWDANTHSAIAGAQDTGTPQQDPTKLRWTSVSTSDGGVVAVDDITAPGHSTRYSSFYDLMVFRRRVYDSSNRLVSEAFPGLVVRGNGARVDPQFYTPIELNKKTPIRLIVGANNSVYESLDQGDSLQEIGPGIRTNPSGPIAYGAADNADALFVGSQSRVFVRTRAAPAPLVAAAAYPGSAWVMGIALDPRNSKTAYVIDQDAVYRTTDAGATWAAITGNLPSLAPGRLLSVAYSTSPARPGVVVGSARGVFIASPPNFSTWNKLGAGLPRALVLKVQYSAADDLLLAATFGRGAWTASLGGP